MKDYITPQNVAAILVLLSSLGYALAQRRLSQRRARIVRAFFVGTKTAIADYAVHKDLAQDIEDGIYAAAADLGLDESHIDEHLNDGLAKEESK